MRVCRGGRGKTFPEKVFPFPLCYPSPKGLPPLLSPLAFEREGGVVQRRFARSTRAMMMLMIVNSRVFRKEYRKEGSLKTA